MSNVDFFAPAGSDGMARPGGFGSRLPTGPAARPPRGARLPAWRRRPALTGFAIAVVVGLLAVGALREREPVGAERPVTLPATFAGVPSSPEAAQFADEDWQDAMASEFSGHPFAGRAFQTGRPPAYHLVVVRGETADRGDAGMGRAPWTHHGEVSCTRTLDLGGPGGARKSPKTLLCVRASDALTVSVLVLLPRRGNAEIAVRGVNEVWALQQ